MKSRALEIVTLGSLFLVAASAGAQQPNPAAPAAAPPAAAKAAAAPAGPASPPGAAPAAAKPAPAPAAAKPAATPAAAPAAAAPAAPPAPKPAPELETFKFFLGRWRCDGKAFVSPMSPTEHAVKATAEAKLEVDNFWQSFSYEEKKTKEHAGLRVKGLWGYDQGSKRYVSTTVGNHGEWNTASAPGWEGDNLVWTGEISGPLGRIPFHHRFTKKSDKEWVHFLEVRTPDGKWVPSEEITCKK
jgi:uncharacterized protein DUF1579